jgi:hypothetical protein
VRKLAGGGGQEGRQPRNFLFAIKMRFHGLKIEEFARGSIFYAWRLG